MTASLFIAVFLFPIVALLCSVHKYPKGVDTGNQMLNKTQTATLKGIFIIVVFFHHFSQIIEVSNLKSLYNSGGYIAVTVFFLIAGYVTVLELERTKDYKQFLYKKILRLYLPILIFTVTFNNFLTGLLFMYAITLIAYRFMPPRKYRALIIITGNIVFVLICMMLDLGEWWYDRVLPYCIGACFAMYKNEFMSCIKKWYSILFSTTFLTFAALWYIARFKSGNVFFVILDAIIEAFLIVLLLYKVDVRSSVFSKLGEYSFEIFFTHQIVIALIGKCLSNNTLILIISFIVTVVLAILIQKLWSSTKIWKRVMQK